jgi:hypothetical protein
MIAVRLDSGWADEGKPRKQKKSTGVGDQRLLEDEDGGGGGGVGAQNAHHCA